MLSFRLIVMCAMTFITPSIAIAQESEDSDLAQIAPSEVAESSVNGGDDFENFAPERSNLVARRVVGCENTTHYCYILMDMPGQLLDQDGGEIRLIMQHETSSYDEVRTIDIHIGCEWTNDSYGDRGRYVGRYCWARQVGGGEYAMILGDNKAHNVFVPWGWAWITDYAYNRGNAVLGGNRIQIMTHPHVTARVFFYD